MKRKQRLPELLAPAGSYEAMLAAVSAGADAIYLAGYRFGARAYAKNFSEDELRRAVRYCHLRGVRVFVTVNTLVWDEECAELISYIKELYKMGVDALIVADLGVLRLARRHIPDMELHASTQLSIHNTDGADAAFRLGASRVVVARELSLEDICSVSERSLAETEVFLHGALCVCHSGQCLFSSLVGGRSGNRGECAQPCRLPYGGGYPLSLCDLSLAGHIRELVECGVASLKIEGRMKSPDYVYRVTSVYRRLLDGCRNATRAEGEELERAFSRSGFTDGYFVKNHKNMLGIRREADKQLSRESDGGVYIEEKTRVFAKASFRLGAPSQMTLYNEKRSVTVSGDAPAAAESAPLSDEAVRLRLSKMGNTLLSLAPEDIELSLDGGINLSPGKINELRRRAADAFESTERELPPAIDAEIDTGAPKWQASTALFLDASVLQGLGARTLSYFDAAFVPLMDYGAAEGRANGVYIPPVVPDSEEGEVKAALASAKAAGAKYALVGNLSHLGWASEAGLSVIADFRMNIANREASRELSGLGAGAQILSSELTERQISRIARASDASVGAVVYGRIPLMLTERCFIKESFGCDNCKNAALTDRRGVSFPIIREYKHRNLILNSAITYMADRQAELSRAGISLRHFIFTLEGPPEIEAVVRAYKEARPYPGTARVPMRRMGKRENTK